MLQYQSMSLEMLTASGNQIAAEKMAKVISKLGIDRLTGVEAVNLAIFKLGFDKDIQLGGVFASHLNEIVEQLNAIFSFSDKPNLIPALKVIALIVRMYRNNPRSAFSFWQEFYEKVLFESNEPGYIYFQMRLDATIKLNELIRKMKPVRVIS
jgi:hypothetical protein